jgi:hypothetical protein
MPSLREFTASFKTDFARPARFDVEIPVPLKLVAYLNTAKQLTLRCENAEFPGKTLATTDRRIYGPSEKQPYLTTFSDSTFTFILSDDMREKRLFDAWMDLINPKSTFDMNYKGDYATPITINQYDVTNKLSYSVTLIDAFPVSVNQLDLDWSNDSTHHRLSVTFAYHTYEGNSIQSLAQDLINAGISTGVDIATESLSKFNFKSPFNPLTPDTSGSVYDMKTIAKGFEAKK